MFTGVVFVVSIIAAVFLILFVLLQDDQGEGMGGIFSGGSSTPFGSNSGNFLQRMTAMFALIFFSTALAFAYFNKQSDEKDLVNDHKTENWIDTEINQGQPVESVQPAEQDIVTE